MIQNRFYSTRPVSTVLFVREGEGEGGTGDGGTGGTGGAGDGNTGSAGGTGNTGSVSQADIQKMIEAAVAEQTKGLKSKNEELLGKLTKANERAKAFDGLDPTKAREMMEKLDQDEDARLLSEGKKNLVIEKYTERMRAQHKSELDIERSRTKSAEERVKAYQGSVLDNQIRAVTTGLHKAAVEDALLHARQIFTLDDKGNAVQLDSEGRSVLGKDGQTPFSPAEWIELQKELKPHWFPSNTSGSGSGGTRDGSSGTGKAIKRADFDRLAPSDQVKVVQAGTKIVD